MGDACGMLLEHFGNSIGSFERLWGDYCKDNSHTRLLDKRGKKKHKGTKAGQAFNKNDVSDVISDGTFLLKLDVNDSKAFFNKASARSH